MFQTWLSSLSFSASYALRRCSTLSAFCLTACLPGPSRILDSFSWYVDSSPLSALSLVSMDAMRVSMLPMAPSSVGLGPVGLAPKRRFMAGEMCWRGSILGGLIEEEFW